MDGRRGPADIDGEDVDGFRADADADADAGRVAFMSLGSSLARNS